MKVKMIGFKVNKKEIDKQVGKSKAFQKRARQEAQKKLNKTKQFMMQEFNSHPVTQELEAGASGTNLSKTLGGYGNLFSFLGFNAGSQPTEKVRAFLMKSFKLKRGVKNKGLINEFTVNAPTIKDFGFAKMPWESGNSWVESIERGISNFSYYMHKAYQASRAGVGMQVDNKINSGASAPAKYMSLILRNFRKRLVK